MVSTKDGKSYNAEVSKDKEPLLYHKRIGDEIDGSIIGLPGYVLKITGGSDTSGFPMRYDIEGYRKLKVYMSKGPGYRPKKKGIRKRKTVRGNEIGETVQQVNTIIVSKGNVDIEEVLGKKEKGEDKEKKSS